MRTLLKASLAVLVLVAAGLLTACGSGSSSGGSTIPRIDENYDFQRAGVRPGVDTRPAGRGLIRGVLTNTSGGVVEGVDVTLYRLSTSRQASVGYAVARSDSRGRYVFGSVPPGGYRVAVQDQIRDLTVRINQDTIANFNGLLGGTGGNVTRAKWTIMILMAADNDLERFAIADVNELERLPRNDDVNIVVLMDRSPGYDTTNGNWTDARRFVIQPDNDLEIMTSAIGAQSLGEIDSGSPETVRDFINWCQTNYPADRYLYNFWNHGSGWRPVGRGTEINTTRGILFDDTAGTYIKAHEMAQALDSRERIDVVTIDCSLMQMGETLAEIQGKTDYIVGSEESPPGEGYSYNVIYRNLMANPGMAPSTLAKDIVSQYVRDVGSRSSVTQSAFRTDRLPALWTALRGYSRALVTADARYHSQILAARNDTQRYGSYASLYDGNRDLIDFLDNVDRRTNNSTLRTAGNQVRAAFDAALLAEGHTGANLSRSHGLAVWLPNDSDWNLLRSSYIRTQFAGLTEWTNWLDTFYRW